MVMILIAGVVLFGAGLYLPLFQQTVQGASATTLQMSGTIAQNSVPLRDMGAAMSSVDLFRPLGGSLGVAVFGSLFTRAVQSAPAGDAYLDAVTTGTGHILLTAAVLGALALLAALFVVEVPLKKAGPPAPSADTTENAPAGTTG